MKEVTIPNRDENYPRMKEAEKGETSNWQKRSSRGFSSLFKGNPITLLGREDAFLMDRERRIAQMVSKDGEKISLIAWSYSMGPETRSK